MENKVDFDELARRANESGGATDALDALFGAAFALEKWHFVARGALPNVAPYIAANAAVAGGEYMVRAFTDTERLARFARENALTAPDGAAAVLSIPAAAVVEYLEQFVARGVHGVWFNSDAASDGFFIPLRQLRPIREHLARKAAAAPSAEPEPPPAAPSAEPEPEPPPAAPAAAEEPYETLIVVVKDGLMLPSGFVSPASYTCNFFCRVPASWIVAGRLGDAHLERLYERVYGPAWRAGNDDGSRFVVFESYSEVFDRDTARATRWAGTENTKENHFWFYVGNRSGAFEKVTADEFQAAIDAAR